MTHAIPSPVVSVVIVTWNCRDTVLRCLRSIADGAASQAIEVIVVDNASSDGTAEAVRREAPGVRVIANATNRGLAAGNNQGITSSSAPFVLISNPDILYQRGAIDELLALMGRRPRAALAVARTVREDGTLQTAAGDLPTLPQALLGRQVARRRAREDAGFWWDGWNHDEERAIGHGLEACYLVRRQAIEDIGLQDERFRLDWEGIDWAARVASGGWEVWFCPRAGVVHLGGVSIRKAQARWVLRSHVGMYRYFAKRRRIGVRPLLAAAFAASTAIKLAGLPLGWARYERSHPGAAPPGGG